MPVARYTTILDKLGLTNSTIDYLKMDVEGFERDFFHDVIKNTPNLLKNVKQIALEIHNENVLGMTFTGQDIIKYVQYKLYRFFMTVIASHLIPLSNTSHYFSYSFRQVRDW